jgi:hypothetical protein
MAASGDDSEKFTEVFARLWTNTLRDPKQSS